MMALTLLLGGVWLQPAKARGEGGSAAMDAVTTLAVSPDGASVASGGRDRRIRLWDSRTGALRRALREQTGDIVSIAFAPNGAFLASGDADGTVVLWDVRTGEQARLLKERTPSRVNCLAYTHDGASLAVGNGGDGVTLWNVQNGTVERTLDTGGFPVHGVAVSRDGLMIAAACGDKTLKLWDARTGALRRTLEHGGIVWSVAFLEGGNLVTACEDGGVRIWDAGTGALKAILAEAPLPVRFLTASLDGRLVAAPNEGSPGPMVWDARTGAGVGVSFQSPGQLQSLAFSPDGGTLVGGGGVGANAIGVIAAWDLRNGAVRWEVSGHLRRVVAVHFSPGGAMIVGGVDGYRAVGNSYVKTGHVEIWDARTAKTIRSLARSEPRTLAGSGDWISAIAISPNGETVLIGRENRRLELWNLRDGRAVHSWRAPDVLHSVAFSPDGKMIACGHEGGLILWDQETGEVAWRQAISGASITALTFAPEGAILATNATFFDHGRGEFGLLKLWNSRSGMPLQSLAGGTSGTGALAFSPNGRTLAAIFRDGTLNLWDVTTGELKHNLKAHRPGWIGAIAFSPDAETILSVSLRNRVQIERRGEVKWWSMRTGALQRTIEVDSQPASSIAISPNGAVLAIGRDNGTVTLVDMEDVEHE